MIFCLRNQWRQSWINLIRTQNTEKTTNAIATIKSMRKFGTKWILFVQCYHLFTTKAKLFFISCLFYFDMFVINSSWLAGWLSVRRRYFHYYLLFFTATVFIWISETETVVQFVYIHMHVCYCVRLLDFSFSLAHSVSFNLDQSNVCHEQKSVYKYAYHSLLI